MGQNLYEPPDVAGWDAGQAWFSTGAMLARMNFASTLAANQRFNLRDRGQARQRARRPEALLSYVLDALPTAPLDRVVAAELANYLRATGAWTGSDAQLQAKVAGLVHSWPDRRSINSYEGHQAPVRQRRRRRVHGDVRRARVPHRSGARAGRARAQPRGAVSERRQRRAQHADPVQRSVLLQPPADARRAGRAGAADRHRLVARARSACIRG